MTSNISDWEITKARTEIGSAVDCVVVRHEPFGVFVSIENTNATGLIERVRMNQDGYNTPNDYPQIGSHIRATVLGFRDWSKQIELALTRKVANSEETSDLDTSLEVGLRITDSGELAFFGIDDVNSRLLAGKQVIRVQEGRTIMKKAGESSDGVKLRLIGFSVVIVVQD